jgi:hypothetical protein
MSDFKLENHGSLFLLRPSNEAARMWLQDTAPEDAQFLGPAMAIEHRYVEGVIEAARNDGLEVE